MTHKQEMCFLTESWDIHMRFTVEKHNHGKVLGEESELSGIWTFPGMLHHNKKFWLHRKSKGASDKHTDPECHSQFYMSSFYPGQSLL